MLDDRTQVWLSRLVGLAVVVLFGWLALAQVADAPRAEPAKVDAGAEALATADDAAGAAVVAQDTPVETSAEPDSGALALPLTLRAGAPRTVRIGVVLVTYADAEGAPPNARPRAKARALAESLAETAKTDFRRASLGGDPGSSEDVGRIPRGVLDPPTEIAVFNMKAGDVSDVLETPRGYWIVKRID